MLYTVTPAPNVFMGVYRHLSECEQFDTKHIYINQLHQVTKEDTVVFGAWEPSTYPMAIRRSKAKTKALLFTSPLLQAQMNEPELDFLETILQLKSKGVIDYLLFADEDTYEVFKGDGVFHLPHPANPNKVEKYRRDIPKESIFCYQPWMNKNKNQIVQLATVKFFQKNHPDVMLYTNGMGPWRKWAVKLELNYDDHGFLPDDKYYKSINSKRCGIHVTLSESFGYCVLDAFLLGVPVLCSPAIWWAPEEVTTENPDDPTSIASDLEYVYREYLALGEKCRNTALNVIKENNKKAKETIGKII